MSRRLAPLALGLLVVVTAALPLAAPVSAAAPTPLTIASAIAPGVVTGLAGFGTSSVVVPAGEKITFLAQTSAPLPGRRIEIWTRSRTSDWRLTTARLEALDGSIHYYATVTTWTAFQARVPADPLTVAATSHGRIATVSANGLTAIGVTCDEFSSAPGGTVARSIVLRSGELVAFTLCANASTGFGWQAPTFDADRLKLVTHRTVPPASPLPGAPGSETWTFRVLRLGTGTVSLAYSQPWAGGQKAAWRFTVAVVAARPTGFSCGSSAHLDATASGEPVVALADVRVGAHPGYDRIVFAFAGDETPGLDLATAKPPFARDASGLPVMVAGRAFLRLTLRGASGAGVYRGPGSFSPRDPRLTALIEIGDFEGVVTWVAGMTGPACHRVSTLAGPTRILVDLQAP